MKTFDTWEQAEQYQSEHGGVIWRHEAGHYAVTESHSNADELPDTDKWTEIERGNLKCKKCGMEYDGPANKFPSNSLCPLCDRSTEAKAKAEIRDQLDAQLDRNIREAYIQGHIDD